MPASACGVLLPSSYSGSLRTGLGAEVAPVALRAMVCSVCLLALLRAHGRCSLVASSTTNASTIRCLVSWTAVTMFSLHPGGLHNTA
jgi:hypothetical protein